MAQLTGRCLCGELRVTATGAPLRVGVCHCLDCRKHHGALFYAAAIFRAEAVKVNGRSQHHAGRHFCPGCGSSVFAQSGSEIEVHLGVLETPDQLIPSYECWTIRRAAWLSPIPGATQYPRDRTE